MRLFDKSIRHFYAEKPDFQVRLLTINGLILLLLLLSEFLLSRHFLFYKPNGILVLVFTLALLALLFVVGLGVGTKKQWAFLLTMVSLIGVSILTYNILASGFNILLTTQLFFYLIALSFLFDRIIHVVIFGSGTLLIYVIACLQVQQLAEKEALFILFIPFSLLVLGYSLKVKLHRLSILEFSESVLTQYDKFVFVYNHFGEIIYMNDFAADKFKFDKNGFQFEKWWTFCCSSEEDIISRKKEIVQTIERDVPVSAFQQIIEGPGQSPMIIEWHVQLIRQRFYIGIGSDITLQQTANIEAERLSKVTQALQAGVATINELGQVTWCNSSYAQIFEYQVAEIIGQRPSQLFGVPAFFTEKYDQILDEGIQIGVPTEIPHYTKSGRLIWILLNTSQIKNEHGALIEGIDVVTDITEQKNEEFQFKQTSLIVERTQTPVIITDRDLTINWFNEAVLKEFNIPFESLIGEKFEAVFFVLNQSHDLLDLISEAIENHNSIKIEVQLRRNDRSEWYKISLDPVRDEADMVTQYMISFDNIQSQKEQQQIIEQKNQDMIASISYAKRIQSAFLPTEKTLAEEMPPHFFYFKPKDIVSGDFYFVQRKGSFLYIAIADCTGHGVPGAMITAIGAASLNNAIFDHGLIYPAEIVEHADRYVKRALSASEDDLTDGMDVGLLMIDFEENEIRFSGARRPLILMMGDKQLIIKGDKRSIGEFHDDPLTDFCEYKWEVDAEIGIYLFSDGIPDQFGGDRIKKIGVRRLVSFIAQNNAIPIDQIASEFDRQMNEWTKDFAITQTDDMLLMGMKISPAYMRSKK